MARQLGYRLRRLRDGMGMTQQQAATAAGISRPYLSMIENSRRYPPPETLLRVAAVLGADLAESEVLISALAERRQDLRELRPFLEQNTDLVILLRILQRTHGNRPLPDWAKGLLGKACGQIAVGLRRTAWRRMPAPQAPTDDGGTGVA